MGAMDHSEVRRIVCEMRDSGESECAILSHLGRTVGDVFAPYFGLADGEIPEQVASEAIRDCLQAAEEACTLAALRKRQHNPADECETLVLSAWDTASPDSRVERIRRLLPDAAHVEAHARLDWEQLPTAFVTALVRAVADEIEGEASKGGSMAIRRIGF